MTTATSSSYITHLRFVHAMAIVRAIPQNSTLQPVAADKLQFYGLYKQATEGDGNKPRPSSRQVVEYAKWKAWNRMKGISPIEAQKLYVESLIQLLTELVHRYPHHEQSSFLKKALYSLEHDAEEDDEELYQDAYDSTEFELQEHFLNNIEPDQLRRQDIYSPPATPGNSSFRSTPTAHIRSSSYYNNHRHNSISDISHTEYPITPITSPGQNSVTGQWVLNQLQQSNASKTNNYVHPMDFLQQQTDTLSEADTIDREVAATTANLALSSPRQSPYSGGDTKKKSNHSPHLSSSSTSSKKKKKDNTRALERLQTEVTALTEQIDRLRRSSIQEKNDRKRWTASRVCMVLIKHLMANSAILIIAFYILWRKKSPIAYSVIDYIRPLMLDLLRKIIRRIVFWKITV